ncbi:MAG: GGDEF domain-containing protein, partial [Clostridiales bacterium]|nr:GGDEF domain-containing protein [Clostridiales bacterium]
YNGCYYTIDSENVYHRGPLMPITIVVLLSTVFVSLYIIIKNKRNIERRYFIALIHFYAVPIVGTVLDIIFYGYSFILNSIAISLLIVLLHTKKRSSEMDYLTGLYNRKRLEAYLLYKIDSSSENRTFSAILIDMDNFKLINDTFGHDMGDDALETAAVLLKKSIRSDDFIARLGGDEFYIILNHSDRKSLELVVSRIKRCVEQYNESGVKPYKLHFSMGYDVYDYSLRQTMKEFQKRVDILMYENKQAKKIEK